MRTIPEIPPEVVINPKRDVVYTPMLQHVLPKAFDYLDATDNAYKEDPLGYLQELHQGLFTISKNGRIVQCSVLNTNTPSEEMLVVFAPFSDSEPKSSPKDIFTYMAEGEEDLKRHAAISKKAAAPNSWSQTLKSATIRDMLEAAGRGMPVLTIYSPMPAGAFTSEQRKTIKKGDFRSETEIVMQAMEAAARRIANPNISSLHFHGMSLGASKAAGAAAGTAQKELHQVLSTTLQELIVGPKNYVPDLAKRFTISSTVGEESQLTINPYLRRLAEPLTRRLSDRDSYEKAAIGRMLIGMSRRTFLKGLTDPVNNVTPSLIEELAKSGVSTMVPLAENSALTSQTTDYLPKGIVDIVRVRADEGHMATHEIDEHVTLLGLLAVANIVRTAKR